MISRIEAIVLAKKALSQGIEETSIPTLISILEVADDLYYNDDDSFLSDPEYDAIYRYVKNTDPNNTYFLGVGSSVRGGKVKLPFQMGSLDQLFEGEVATWIANNKLLKNAATITDKLDGASAAIVYKPNGEFQIGYSRGDGIEGADISRHLTKMNCIPKKIKTDGQSFMVRGENIIAIDTFKKIQPKFTTRSGKPYKNARNMISGVMNASTNPPDLYQYLDFVAYEIVGSELSKTQQLELLKQLGFKTVKYVSSSFDKINDESLTIAIKNAKQTSSYELDGIVVDVDEVEKRAEMNPTRDTLNPAYSFKFKVADDSNIAFPIVVDVEINISKHGYLKPRIRIEPVELVGVTVTYATGFNMKFIKDNKIGPGAKIQITRSGDVIPYVAQVIHPMTTSNEEYDEWFNNKISTFGDSYWTPTGVDLVLTDASTNDQVKFEQLVDFFDTLNVSHLGEGNLRKMFDMGFHTPESIIELLPEDIGNLVDSQSIGKKIFTSLREKLTDVPMYLLMGAHPAFGRGIGVRKMKKLYEHAKGDWSKFDNQRWIESVDGFDTKTAIKIANGLPIFCDFYLNVVNIATIKPYEAPIQGTLTNKAIVFTGFRDSALEKRVEAAGGKIGSAVSSKTSLVVTTDVNGKSGKLDKARTLNIQIISVEQLKELLN